MNRRRSIAIRATGALIGTAAALTLVAAARPGSGVAGLPASIRFALAPPGTLSVTPAAPASVLDAKRLVPGGRPLTARFTVRNQSGVALQVGLHAIAAVHNLDGLLRIRITSGGGHILADTTLQGLRRDTELGPPLAWGAVRALRVKAWIPGAITDGYQGVAVEGMFALTAQPPAGAA